MYMECVFPFILHLIHTSFHSSSLLITSLQYHKHFYNLPTPPLYWSFIPGANLYLIPCYFLYFCSLHSIWMVTRFEVACSSGASCCGYIDELAYKESVTICHFSSQIYLPAINNFFNLSLTFSAQSVHSKVMPCLTLVLFLGWKGCFGQGDKFGLKLRVKKGQTTVVW